MMLVAAGSLRLRRAKRWLQYRIFGHTYFRASTHASLCRVCTGCENNSVPNSVPVELYVGISTNLEPNFGVSILHASPLARERE